MNELKQFPRVKISYDVETGGSIEKRELPFVIAILAPLSNNNPEPLSWRALN